MWRPRRTFKGVMRWRMKDPPDLAMRCRFAAILLVGFCGAFHRGATSSTSTSKTSPKLTKAWFSCSEKERPTRSVKAGRSGFRYGKDPLTCPVRAICEWIAEAQITSQGPFLRPSQNSAGPVRRDSLIASSPRSSKSTASKLGNEFRSSQATRFGPALPPPRRLPGLPKGRSRSRRAMPV